MIFGTIKVNPAGPRPGWFRRLFRRSVYTVTDGRGNFGFVYMEKTPITDTSRRRLKESLLIGTFEFYPYTWPPGALYGLVKYFK